MQLIIYERCTSVARIASHIAISVVIALMIIVGLFGSKSMSTAAQPSNMYSFKGTSCSDQLTDPVGVVFAGTRAGVTNTVAATASHAGWIWSGVGLNQSLNVYRQSASRQCHKTTNANATAGTQPLFMSRYHVRYWLSWLQGGQPKTVGTPHNEKVVVCVYPFPGVPGHVVRKNGTFSNNRSGFTEAKHVLKAKLSGGGHATSSSWWGNTRSFRQCNGNYAGGDGYVAVIFNNHGH